MLFALKYIDIHCCITYIFNKINEMSWLLQLYLYQEEWCEVMFGR